MSQCVVRRCERCQQAALMDWASIFCTECRQRIDEIGAWRLAFWNWFGLARRARKWDGAEEPTYALVMPQSEL